MSQSAVVYCSNANLLAVICGSNCSVISAGFVLPLRCYAEIGRFIGRRVGQLVIFS